MQSQWIATFAWSKNRRIINMLALLLDDYLKEEACMKYINAKNLLPDALVKELQSYIQGGYLYVPPIKRSKNDGEKFRATGRNYSNETVKS